MDYFKLYNKAISTYLVQIIDKHVYTERHHIVPRHMGGTDDEDNFVTVTYRQHILLHLLLWKIHSKPGDLMAYKLMKGQIDTVEARRELQRLSKLGKKWSPEFREYMMECRKETFTSEDFLNKIRKTQLKAAKLKSDKAKDRSESIIANSEKNIEWLSKTSSKSKYKFVSPDGLIFDSPIFAAKYYGQGCKHIDIENWCKRKKYGWNTITELAKK